MTPQAHTHVRKRNHLVELGLPGVDEKAVGDFIDAIYFVEPSIVRRTLIMVICQPMIGNVHTTVMTMAKQGVEWCRIWTLLPDRPDLLAADTKGQMVFRYKDGTVIDHRLPLTEGEDFMIHEIEIDFRDCKVEAHEWAGTPPAVRSPLTLVQGGLTNPAH